MNKKEASKRTIEIIKNKNLLLVISLLAFLFLFNSSISAAATTPTNKTTQEQAALCLNESTEIMNNLYSNGFNILRVNDTIRQATLVYSSQVVVKQRQGRYDFSGVVASCEEIKKIRSDAFIARDELSALLKFYNDSVVPGMNTSTIDALITQMQDDLQAERYEEVISLIDKTYSEISNVKSSYTTLNVFYTSTARGIKAFFEKNWKIVVGLLIVIIIAFLAYRTKIQKSIINYKINSLSLRKKTIKELIMKLQVDYFQEGKVPEGEYNIKTKKFAELIRDIDRQIPLLKEQLAKIDSKTIEKSNRNIETNKTDYTNEINQDKSNKKVKQKNKSSKIVRNKKNGKIKKGKKS